jgi:hypothetical protein
VSIIASRARRGVADLDRRIAVLYLRHEQVVRLDLMRRLRGLRRLAKRTIPLEEYGQLGLDPRRAGVELHNRRPSLDTIGRRFNRGVFAGRSSRSQIVDDVAQFSSDFDLPSDYANREFALGSVDAGCHHSTSGQALSPQYDGRDHSEDQTGGRSDVPMQSETSNGARGSAYPTTLEAVMAIDYQSPKRVPMASDRSMGDVPYRNQEHTGPESCLSELEAQAEGDDPPVIDLSDRSQQHVMIDWEGEWSGGAFIEGEDLEA